ncbi:15519_t:CDS:10 [Acaulospora morrowiae]|uniref:tRNA-5-taurinomethyluridine 2-sulfurtransferase n=1 Tax=Acaulospora morrowiae TaxID=94023 RepID=A0A9N8V044_9GLOM|nr:15519_t:CDS:10 [Acaulospora morrowiae]
MSGGVDSSVSAYLLQRQGFIVEGVYMRNWDIADEEGECTSDQDWQDVRMVCDQLKIPCRQVDFTKEYWVHVFVKMIEDYESGITPNPDITCNRKIKFGWFLDRCLNSIPERDKSSTWVATGHYVQNEITDSGRIKLLRGADSNKDQSYFLSTVPEEKFRNVIFPVGHLLKKEVREIALKADLIVACKKESMGICFVGKKKTFSKFLEQYIVSKPGDVKTLDGVVIVKDFGNLGQHNGQFAYTIGQRARINDKYKWFVHRRDSKENTLIAVPGSDHPAFFSKGLIAKDWIWSWNEPPEGIREGVELLGQVRYRQYPGMLFRFEIFLNINNSCRPDDSYIVEFQEPQWAIAPGQYVVVWKGDWCLGAGVIHDTID